MSDEFYYGLVDDGEFKLVPIKKDDIDSAILFLKKTNGKHVGTHIQTSLGEQLIEVIDNFIVSNSCPDMEWGLKVKKAMGNW